MSDSDKQEALTFQQECELRQKESTEAWKQRTAENSELYQSIMQAQADAAHEAQRAAQDSFKEGLGFLNGHDTTVDREAQTERERIKAEAQFANRMLHGVLS